MKVNQAGDIYLQAPINVAKDVTLSTNDGGINSLSNEAIVSANNVILNVNTGNAGSETKRLQLQSPAAQITISRGNVFLNSIGALKILDSRLADGKFDISCAGSLNTGGNGLRVNGSVTISALNIGDSGRFNLQIDNSGVSSSNWLRFNVDGRVRISTSNNLAIASSNAGSIDILSTETLSEIPNAVITATGGSIFLHTPKTIDISGTLRASNNVLLYYRTAPTMTVQTGTYTNNKGSVIVAGNVLSNDFDQLSYQLNNNLIANSGSKIVLDGSILNLTGATIMSGVAFVEAPSRSCKIASLAPAKIYSNSDIVMYSCQNDLFELRSGEILIQAKSSVRIDCGDVLVLAKKGSFCLVSRYKSHISVTNLFDRSLGDVQVHLPSGNSIKLGPGRNLLINDSNKPNDGLGRRALHSYPILANLMLHSSQVSLAGLLLNHKLIKSVFLIDTEACNRMMKIASALAVIDKNKEPFRP